VRTKTAQWITRKRFSKILLIAALAFFASAGNTQATSAIYRLSSGDQIKVTVYGHEDLSGEFEVDSEGAIGLPLIDEVSAAGLTVEELEIAITNELKPDYLRNPNVTVEVLSYRPVFILGEVKAPGAYAFAKGMTVVNVVALAGGYTYRARTKAIVITRRDGEAKDEIEANADTVILPGDVIEVPERYF
jgi:polysaccharide export outer membrane protein